MDSTQAKVMLIRQIKSALDSVDEALGRAREANAADEEVDVEVAIANAESCVEDVRSLVRRLENELDE